MIYARIAVEAPLPRPLTYRIPPHLQGQLAAGVPVEIPLGRRKSRGVCLEVADSFDDVGKFKSLKDVSEVIAAPHLGPRVMNWLRWLAQYYLHPPGQVYALALAPGDETRKRKSRKASPTIIESDAPERQPAPNPTPAQSQAIQRIVEAAEHGQFQTFLLLGVTGSGKTEVYLQSIARVLETNRKILVLVPEISLTPQLIRRFVGRFGDNVAVIHSHLTERERSDQWWSVVRGKKQILVGARSALFCPVEDLGLIIVDEEHESSFKQEEQLKYNARDAAIMRARLSSCPVVLGSATPSLESWQNALTGKSTLLELNERVENRPLPNVELIDMRDVRRARAVIDRPWLDPNPLPYWLSPRLFDELQMNLGSGEQSALFLNRRGFAQFLLCPACGFVEECPHCSVSLTVHHGGRTLHCHYCGYEQKAAIVCRDCRQEDVKAVGLGTEKMAEDLARLFPQAKIGRADRDEIKSREDLEEMLRRMNNREIDILIGTQMIAKGHDFPELTLVGVVIADLGLHFPDFRSSERTFQLLTQVAGRAGRHKKPGRVLVQTMNPEHPAIQLARLHDFRGFAEQELKNREELGYPPFGRLAVVRIQGTRLDRVEADAQKTRMRLQQLQKHLPADTTTEILGPTEAVVAKIKNQFRYQILLKCPSVRILNMWAQGLLSDSSWIQPGVKLAVDVDPLHLL